MSAQEPAPGGGDGGVAVGGVQFFGQYLLGRGLISAEALREALAYQQSVNLPLGALALSKGLLSEKQVLVIHTEQRRSDRMFGEIAILKGFISRQQLDELLREQKEARVLLGDALVKKGYLTWEQVGSAYKVYQREQEASEAQVKRSLALVTCKLLVETTVQMSSRMLLRMGGQITKLAAVDLETRLVPRDYLFWQEVEGDQPFTYYLSVSTPELLLVARHVLESIGDPERPEEVDLLVLDVGKEFVNVVVGHICTRLSHDGLNCMPLPPDHAEGQDFHPRIAEGWTRINIRLVMPLGEVALSLHCPIGEGDQPTTRSQKPL